jgi:hypothetical protein
MITKAEALARTIKRADELMTEGLEFCELTLRDCGCTEAELRAALGPGGYWRCKLQQARDEMVEAEALWIAFGIDGTRH